MASIRNVKLFNDHKLYDCKNIGASRRRRPCPDLNRWRPFRSIRKAKISQKSQPFSGSTTGRKAARFYTSVFEDSRNVAISHYTDAALGKRRSSETSSTA